MELLPERWSRPGWRVEDLRGTPLTIAGQHLTPVERVTELGRRHVVVSWRRPVFVEVRQGDTVRRLPIRNLTRRAMAFTVLAELALGTLGAVGLQVWKGYTRGKRGAQ